MRGIILILNVVLFAGCLFPVTQNLQGIIQTYKNYTLHNVAGSFDALNLKKHNPEDALVFIEFGVDSCVVADFYLDKERYNVEIYSFLNPKGAIGAYFITEQPNTQPLKLGYYARKTENAVQFVKGHYFVSVQSMQGNHLKQAVELASGFEKRIEGGSITTDIFQTLPKKNLLEDSEFYFSGPRAFKRKFSAQLCEALNIKFAIDGTAAKYTINLKNVDFIKIQFPGRAETLEAVDSYLTTYEDRPILRSQESLKYNTVIEEDRSEVYIAEYGSVLMIMLGADSEEEGKNLFEYFLRGGK